MQVIDPLHQSYLRYIVVRAWRWATEEHVLADTSRAFYFVMGWTLGAGSFALLIFALDVVFS